MPATDLAPAAWMGEAVAIMPPEAFVGHVGGEQFVVSFDVPTHPGVHFANPARIEVYL